MDHRVKTIARIVGQTFVAVVTATATTGAIAGLKRRAAERRESKRVEKETTREREVLHN